MLCDMVTTKAVPRGHNRRASGVWGEVEECIKNALCYKGKRSSNPASNFDPSIARTRETMGYKRELKLIEGLKGVIYEKSPREMNM